MIISFISIAPYLTDKGEHTALYKDKKNVYTKTPKIILYSHIVLNTHTRTDARTHSRSYARTHACTHARTHAHTQVVYVAYFDVNRVRSKSLTVVKKGSPVYTRSDH